MAQQGGEGREAARALALGPAALGPGQCQLPPGHPKPSRVPELYEPWLSLKAPALVRGARFKRPVPPPSSSTQASALSCALLHGCLQPSVAPSIKSNCTPFVGLPEPHDSLTMLSPLFLRSTHIPKPRCSSAWNILSQDHHRLISLTLCRSLLQVCQATQRGLSVHTALPGSLALSPAILSQ